MMHRSCVLPVVDTRVDCRALSRVDARILRCPARTRVQPSLPNEVPFEAVRFEGWLSLSVCFLSDFAPVGMHEVVIHSKRENP